MEKRLVENLLRMRVGIVLSLATLLFGFLMGGAFGAAESNIKAFLTRRAETSMDSVYEGNRHRAKRVVNKSWSYFKRAHMHGGGLGAASLSMILLLALLPGYPLAKKAASFLLGFGGLGYALFWLFAGLRAPSIGDTHLAKESLAFLAIPSAAAVIIGTVCVIATFCLFFARMRKSR